MWRDMPLNSVRRPSELPRVINFEDVFNGQPMVPPATADQMRSVLKDAKSINFTSPAQDAKSGQQPDYFLGADGKLRPNPLKTTPNKDGSVNIEVQSKNKNEIDSKKLADQLQKATIKDLINYFKNSHPAGTKVPQDWLDMLSKEPDLPPPVMPLGDPPAPAPDSPPPPADLPQQPAPPPQPAPGSDGGSAGGSSGGSSGGNFGGDSGGSSGGSSGGRSGGDSGGGSSGGSSDGGTGAPASNDLLSNVKIVEEVAKEKGVDPVLAVATMLQESGGDAKAVGDGGHSIGLFQLNDQGEGAGMSVAQREDPRANAETALSVFAQNKDNVRDINGDGQITGGDLASQSQRPADMPGYVGKVDGLMGRAQDLIAQADAPPPSTGQLEVGAWGGFTNGNIPDSALKDVYGFKVAPHVAENLTQLLDAAQKDGVWNPSEKFATGTYRTYDQQVQLWNEHQAGTHPAQVATPGKSMHGWGEAIDFNMNNPKLISWLKDNAEKYGFKNLPSEPWHYSTNGA
jgi:hypothetical protein